MFGYGDLKLLANQVVYICMLEISKGFIWKVVVSEEPGVPVALPAFVIHEPFVRKVRYSGRHFWLKPSYDSRDKMAADFSSQTGFGSVGIRLLEACRSISQLRVASLCVVHCTARRLRVRMRT